MQQDVSIHRPECTSRPGMATRAGFINSVSSMVSKAFHLGLNERQQSLDQALRKAKTPDKG